MGDGSPSLAPQWLKSANSLSLRPGSHSSAASDDSKSWRDSGSVPSRLGLGAGADREAASEGKPHTPTSRRERGSFTDRSTGRGYQPSLERRSSFPRTPTRPLSDRELLEQGPSFSAPPPGQRAGGARGGDEAGAGFPSDTFKPASSHKDNGRAPLARSGSGSRKLQGNQRLGGSPQPQADREGGSLGRQVSLSPRPSLGGLPSPRAAPAEPQPWTPRVPEPTPTATLADASAATAAPGAASAAPRMADAILQAQATASQEAEARRLAAARKEQLALRQSKQLVPMVANPNPRTKHAPPASLPAASLLTSLKKPSGLEPLGRASLPTLIPAARKEEDVKALPAPAPVRADPSGGHPSPRAAPPGSKPARERDRLNFFSNLKRKTSAGAQENGNLRRQESNVSETASLGESPRANGSATPSNHEPSRKPAEGAAAEADAGSMPEMTPEEIAFMRSLGWEDTGDDTEGGLTEEEVAAFKAQQRQAPASHSSAKGKQCTPPLRIPVHTNGAAKPPARGAEPRSFHSELEFSDSDSEQ